MAQLSENATKIFRELYCIEGESISECFQRVSREFATNNPQLEDVAYELLSSNTWRPNSPVFFNAGTNHKMFSACYTVSLDDSMDGIYDVVNVARKIFQNGAGVGIPIGNLREKDAPIYEGDRSKVPTGKTSGPISFMKLFDAVGSTTKSGGRTRRAAILCSMPVWHVDILDFISCKEKDGTLSNMNISVSITDSFMKALEDNVPFSLRTPYDGSIKMDISPSVIWENIAKMSHKTGDPGIIFIDTVNRFNPLKKILLIEVTNPCGEQPLPPYLACNLSSINVSKFVSNGTFNFNSLYETSMVIMELMDNLIDVMDFPDRRYKENVMKYRPVGIGIMGLSDTLFELGVPYSSAEGRKIAGDIMKTITTACIEKSALLAKKHGPVEDWEIIRDDFISICKSITDNNEKIISMVEKYGVRNIQHTTCPPTGTTAISCDCSYGIEPSFGIVFIKNLIDGSKMTIVNQVFNKYKNQPWFTDDILNKIAKNGGSLKSIRGVPKEVRDVFVVAHDIKPKDRLEMQAALQKYCSTAISSTINLPKETTVEEIADIYLYAYKLGLKGITIYRDGSKQSQPVTFKTIENEPTLQVPTPIKPLKRPKKMPSTSYQLSTGNGDMLVDVATYGGKPMQVVINIGKSGQVFNTLLEAMGRCISIGLQHGVPVDAFIKTMEGINSDRVIFTRLEDTDKKPTQILSIPDGIAKLLKRYYGSQSSIEESYATDDEADDYRSVSYTSTSEICTKCGNASIIKMEGCSLCTNCLESKCG